jgi:hypothetical protein
VLFIAGEQDCDAVQRDGEIGVGERPNQPSRYERRSAQRVHSDQ